MDDSLAEGGSETVRFRRTAGWWIPAVAGAVAALVVRSGAGPGWTALLAIAVGLVVFYWAVMAATGRVRIEGGLLSVRGGPPFNGYNAGSPAVDLNAVTRCYSIALTQYGAEVTLWPIRTIVVLEDAHGGRQHLPMRWWSGGSRLRDLLRQSVTTGQAECDATVTRWLSLPADPSTRRTTRVRRFGPRS